MAYFIDRVFGWFRTKPAAPTPPAPDRIPWFRVTFDDAGVSLDVSAPGRAPWTDFLPWDSIERVAFEATDFLVSDDLYIWATDRPESRLIPMDGVGAADLWFEIMKRGLFPHELGIKAMASSGLFVWPAPSA